MSELFKENKALNYAVSYIDRRPRTEKQVRDKLREKGFSDEDIDHAVHRLHEDLLLGDEEYARSFISSRLSIKPISSRQLESQLIKNGIPRDMARAALSELDEDTDLINAQDAARKIVSSYVRSSGNIQDEEQYRNIINKTVRRLMSRGYRYEHAKSAAEAAAQEAQDASDT